MWACIVVLFGLLVVLSAELLQVYNKHILIPMALTGIIIFFAGNGTGKPCLSTFLGDQFGTSPSEQEARSAWFSNFYMCIQIGALAFSIGVPFALQYLPRHLSFLTFLIILAPLFVALSIFVLPSASYNKKKAGGNVFYKFLHILFLGWCSDYTELEGAQHWLDKAKRTYTPQEVEDAKAVLRVLVIFVPLPFFWAVFFQMYSIWVFQAQEMNTKFGNFVLPPATTTSINGILDIILIPCFTYADRKSVV